MVHKPIAIMILPILVAGILMLGILAATARGEDNNAGGGETQAPPATETPPPAEAPPATETPPPAEAPPATETPPPAAPPATETPSPAAPPAGAPQESNNIGNATASQTSNNTAFVNTILEMLNRERAAVGVPPLVWSDSLAAGSKTWADSIAATGVARHATDAEKGSPYGEVIAVYGPPGPGSLIPMVQFWINE